MQKEDATPMMPRWKKFTFIVITLSLPILLLAIVEFVLRISGYGGYPTFIRAAGDLSPGQTLCMVEPTATKPYFFANPTRPGYAETTNFLMPKPAGTVRIFLFGESAAKGYPQPRNLSMSAFLQSMLSDAWPGRTVEIINLGTTAVASFPIVYMVEEALQYQPDLLIFYVGNNEFFGAYGTASINSAGTLPTWALPLMRSARGLALVQVCDGFFRSGADENRTLMEQMIGQSVIEVDSPLRTAAARNIRAHMDRMIRAAQSAGVPAIVCTTASNESGLAPLGLTSSTPGVQAPVQFAEGERLAKGGDLPAARKAFLDARDQDTMPWRPTSGTERAVRDSALESGAILCDIADRFRSMSPTGATGWDLLDDHVHLSLRGQGEAARAIVSVMDKLPDSLRVDSASAAALPAWSVYASRLGTNEYDDYCVNHTLRVLFGVPFMKRTNAAAFNRFDELCRAAESRMSPAILELAKEWQTSKPHAGASRPLVGMVARVLLREGKAQEALRYYALAEQHVPDYNSWHLEYVYFQLACKEKLTGSLTDTDRAVALAAINEGKFLLSNGFSTTGFTERYVGRLYQLYGDWAAAIPFLLAARPRMNAEDLVACDQALVLSYIRTKNATAARQLVERGLRESGRFTPLYGRMQEEIERTLPSAPAR